MIPTPQSEQAHAMVTIHGIKTCDTVRKARRWLDQHAIEYHFRDTRENQPSRAELEAWLEHCDWQQLLNRRSTTWKGLDEERRAGVVDADAAMTLLMTNPTLIKRPLLTTANGVHLGFSPEQYQTLFAAA